MNTHNAMSEYGLTEDEIDIIKGAVTTGRMKKDIERYTTIPSRHVSHAGNTTAVDCIVRDLSAISNGQMWLRTPQFKLRRSPGRRYKNVEAMLHGVNSSEVIIIAAHLDSSADRDPSYRPALDPAPGADDDASGIAGVLAAARAIMRLNAEFQPDAPRAHIRFTLFNAEEQAQRGSRRYARREKKQGTPIVAVYQMDMIGHRGSGAAIFELHAGYKKRGRRRRQHADHAGCFDAVQEDSLEVAHHLVEVCSAAGLPLRPQVYFHTHKKRDPGQGASDHTSFHRHGFPAVLVTENFHPGPGSVLSDVSPNPDYHLPEDLLGNLDLGYAAAIARAVTAAAWHRATRGAVTAPSGSAAGPAHGSGHASGHGKPGAAGATEAHADHEHGAGAGGTGGHA